MAEFGHIATGGPGVRVDAWSAGPFEITINGKVWIFEDSDRFGPLILRKDGIPAKRQPGDQSPFWEPHSLWYSQGRRLAEDGKTCIYNAAPLPAPTLVRHLGGKNYEIIQAGDEDGEIIVVEPDDGPHTNTNTEAPDAN